MSEKRKDNKGRVLRVGESQRKDLLYQYRYTDLAGVRRTIYEADLKTLREREAEIHNTLKCRMDYSKGGITVLELVQRYVDSKKGLKHNTKLNYDRAISSLQRFPFSNILIRDVKVSDAKQWIVDMYEDGFCYGTISTYRGIVAPAFKMACEEEIIIKNPFVFNTSAVIPRNITKKNILTHKQEEKFLSFVKTSNVYKKKYNMFVILIETGMRVSELCGLTKDDVDLKNRRVHINKQLMRPTGEDYFIETPKSSSGERFIPMSEKAYWCFLDVVENRPKPKVEWTINGYGGFLFLDRDQKPKVAAHIENELRYAIRKYRKLHPNDDVPYITPHSLRHTFCTRLIEAGVDVKTVQYLMGHADSSTTLNIYTHISYNHVLEQVSKVENFGSFTKKTRKAKA